MDVAAAGATVTRIAADVAVETTLVAETVSMVEVFTLGALYRPEELTLPNAALQVTAGLLKPVTAAVNCWDWPALT